MPYLFLVNFVIFFVGMGLSPLLAVYATGFGATPTLVGLYMAFISMAISAGTLLTGRLVARMGHRVAFLGAGVLGIPALILMGHATALWQAVLLTGVVWFSGGVGTASVSVLTGLYADDKSRGKSFGLMFLALPLAGVFGGVIVGQLVTWQGYPLMFAVLAGVWSAWPLVGMIVLGDVPAAAAAGPGQASGGRSSRPGAIFLLLLVVVFLSSASNSIGWLGMSLSMQALAFSPGAMASTSTVGGLVTIPVALLMGALSDRMGRRTIVAAAYLLASGGILSLGMASQLWQFWLATALLFLIRSANGSVAAALAADILAPEALNRGLPRLNAMTWLAGIAGSAGAGYLIDALGISALYVLAAGLGVLATAALALLPLAGRPLSLPRMAWPRRHPAPLQAPGCAA
jgi:MFS family permease